MSRQIVFLTLGTFLGVGCTSRAPLPRAGTVQVEGATLEYVVEGGGTPLLVFGSSVYYPRTFSPRLREHFQLVFADARHFAATGEDFDVQTITVDTYAADIDAIRDALGLERVAVLGHSIHGALALEYARRYPNRVSHVIAVGAPPVGIQAMDAAGEAFWTEHASDERKLALARNWTLVGPDSLATLSPGDALMAAYVTNGPRYWFDPDYDASPLWKDMTPNVEVFTRLMGELFGEYHIAQEPTIESPVLVVMGRHDYVVPHILWDDVSGTLSNLRYELFDESGHTPQLEEPERFDALLLEWMGEAGF